MRKYSTNKIIYEINNTLYFYINILVLHRALGTHVSHKPHRAHGAQKTRRLHRAQKAYEA